MVPYLALSQTDPPPKVLVFILTLLLLSIDFYYLKNIAGRRLVGLRWWNEVNTATGDSHWVYESAEGTGRVINATDKRFFWLSMYIAPVLWVGLGVLALVRMVGVIWLVIVGEFFLFVFPFSVLPCVVGAGGCAVLWCVGEPFEKEGRKERSWLGERMCG